LKYSTGKVKQIFKNSVAENSSKAKASDFLSARKLVEFKKVALRQGIWFKTLNRIERGVIDLTVKCVENVKSEKLAKVVVAIIEKLQLAMESIADRLVRTIGLPLARKFSDIAVGWGNLSASKWADDHAYARYLTLNVAKER
jgi:hypothetical protein